MDFGFSVKVQQITKHTDMANVARKTLFIQLSTSMPKNKRAKFPFELFLHFLHVYQHKAHLLYIPEKLYNVGASCQAMAGPFF